MQSCGTRVTNHNTTLLLLFLSNYFFLNVCRCAHRNAPSLFLKVSSPERCHSDKRKTDVNTSKFLLKSEVKLCGSFVESRFLWWNITVWIITNETKHSEIQELHGSRAGTGIWNSSWKATKAAFLHQVLSALKINHVADVETEIINFTDSLLHFDSLQIDYFRTVSLLEFYSSLT